MVSASTNGNLNVWNLRKHKDLNPLPLEALPSCLTFSPSETMLAVGLRNGSVVLFENGKYTKSGVIGVIENSLEKNPTVLRVMFSGSGRFLAISYLCFNQANDIYNNSGGYVRLYELAQQREDGNRNFGIKFVEIDQIWNPEHQKKNVRNNWGSFFMSFDEQEEHLILNFQIIDENLNRNLEDKENSLIVYKIKERRQETNKDAWKELKMQLFELPNNINCRRKVLLKENSGEQMFKKFKMRISSICDMGDYVVLGGAKGGIHIVKKTFLYMEDDYTHENMVEAQYCLGKQYVGHDMPVDFIESTGKYLFTSSICNENIFQWEVVRGKKDWELDHKDYKMEIDDIFLRGIERKEEYLKIVKEMLPLRNEIVELKQNVDTSIEPELSLKLEKVIGRKAFNRRKNMFYTQDNHLVFSAASLIVLMNIPPEGFELTAQNRAHFFKESFLEPDSKNDYSVSPEISTFAISKDRKCICVGTIQSKAKIITWELTSRTYLNSLILEDCCVVLNLSFSYDMKSIGCVALTKHYTQRVYLIQTENLVILGTVEFNLSTPIKIKDIEFLPKQNSEFITIGLQHMSHWQYKGGCLTFTELAIENPHDVMQRAGVLHILQEREHRKKILKQEDKGDYKPEYDEEGNEIFPLNVTFLAVIFLYEKLIVTAGDDGYVRLIRFFPLTF